MRRRGALGEHRDPFGRLVLAQAQSPVVSRDGAFEAYGVDVIWDDA